MGNKEIKPGVGSSICGGLPDEKSETSDREALLKERATVSEVRTIKAEHLVPILEWAYGNRDFKNRSKDYWKGMWDFVPDEEKKKKWPDETKKTYDYLKSILKWASDKKTRGHLDPPPGLPRPDEKGEVDHIVPNWSNPNEVNEAVAELARYYYNKAKPQNITPLLALNKEGFPLGVLTIRWKGDPYNPYVRVAGIETFIVNPRLQNRGIGKTLFATAVEHVFSSSHYDTREAEEVRAWVMQDEIAGDYRPNWAFVRKFGFRADHSNPHWPEYAEKSNFATKRGDATWFRLKKEWYEQVKKNDPNIKSCDIIGA